MSDSRSAHRNSRLLNVLVALVAVLAMMPTFATGARAADSATITVNSFLEDGSTPLPFARFQITDSNGTIYGPLETRPGNGSVTFTVDVDDSTTFSIEEETPPACGIAPDPQEVGPFADGNDTSVDFSTSFANNCNLGAISIYSYTCPDGIDASATDYAVFRDGCATTRDGETFVASESQGNESWNLVTGAYGISGRAPLVGLVPGKYDVVRDKAVPDTQTVSFCLNYPGVPDGSSQDPAIAQMDVVDDGYSIDLDGDRIACDFFAVPGSADSGSDNGDGIDPTAEPTEEAQPTPDEGDTSGNGDVNEGDVDDTGTLVVHLASCPAGYSAGDYFNDCHDNGIEGVHVTLDGPNGFSDSMDTMLLDNPGPGVASFIDLESGEYKVTEDIPGDAVTYIVYCSHAESDEIVDFTYDDSTSESVVLDITDGLDVVCDWYIIPDQQQAETGKLTITKYTCPVGTETENQGTLSSTCTDPTDGVTYTVSPESGGGDLQGVSGDAGSGKVRFLDLAPDNYDVSEDVPGEFSSAVVWCHLPGQASYQKDLDNSQTTIFDVEAGDDIRCAWYNRPEDLSGGGSIRIHKSLCPAGLTSGYYAKCYDDTLADVTFDIDGPGSFSDSDVTGDNGLADFTDLNAGSYTITETPPDSVHTAVYVVVCTRDGNNFNFVYDDSTGLRIKLSLPAGAEVVCDWYNVPPAKPTTSGGSVTVIKYLCEGKKDNKYDWDNDCESFGSGATFDLTRVSNGTTSSGTTGNNGRLVFSGLANGAYTLDETSGDWCHAEAEHVDSSGNVLVQDGGNTDVFIYNCSKNVVTLPATGAGPLSDGSNSLGSMMIYGLLSMLTLAGFAFRLRQQPVAQRVTRD